MSSVDPIDRAGGGVNRILMLLSSCKGTFTRHVTVQSQPKEHSHVMFLFRPTTNGTFTRHVPVQTHNQWNIHTSCSCSDPQPMEHSHVMLLFSHNQSALSLCCYRIHWFVIHRINITTQATTGAQISKFDVRFCDDKQIIIIHTQNLWQTVLCL